jgi:hypothetical protein
LKVERKTHKRQTQSNQKIRGSQAKRHEERFAKADESNWSSAIGLSSEAKVYLTIHKSL